MTQRHLLDNGRATVLIKLTHRKTGCRKIAFTEPQPPGGEQPAYLTVSSLGEAHIKKVRGDFTSILDKLPSGAISQNNFPSGENAICECNVSRLRTPDCEQVRDNSGAAFMNE